VKSLRCFAFECFESVVSGVKSAVVGSVCRKLREWREVKGHLRVDEGQVQLLVLIGVLEAGRTF